MKRYFALVWKSSVPSEVFEAAVPSLMEWLRWLKDSGCLKACGGWTHKAGGLTIVSAETEQELADIHARNPLNQLGITEVFEWDLFYADLQVANLFKRSQPPLV